MILILASAKTQRASGRQFSGISGKQGRSAQYDPVLHQEGMWAMSHFVISKGIDKAEDLKGFSLDGYTRRAGLSADTEWVFSR